MARPGFAQRLVGLSGGRKVDRTFRELRRRISLPVSVEFELSDAGKIELERHGPADASLRGMPSNNDFRFSI